MTMRCYQRVLCIILMVCCGLTQAYSEPNSDTNKGMLKKELRIGVSGVISPKEAFSYYVDLVDYIGRKAGIPAKLILRTTYHEMDVLLERKRVDIAFICSGPYVKDHKNFGIELLVVPQVNGQTLYYAYVIAHKDSPIQNLAGFYQKTFAFTDPDSNTGKLVPSYMLSKMGHAPETFFKNYIYTYGHDNSIKAVAQGIVDGASVDSLIYDYIKAKYPASEIASTKVVEKLGGFGIPPVVAHPELDASLKEELRQIFLQIHNDAEGRKILQGIMIEKFVLADDNLYDSIRKMQDWIDLTEGE